MNRQLLRGSSCAGAAILVAVATANQANSAVLFNFDYRQNANGVGFLDPLLGTERQNALQDAADAWGTQFDHNATITLSVTSSSNPQSNTLASAGSQIIGFSNNTFAGFGSGDVIRRKVLSDGNEDLNGSSNDGILNFNWGQNWGLSSNPNDVNSSEFDFYSVVFHELNHALGFSSFIAEDGTDPFDNPNIANVWSKFDQFIVDMNGNPVIDPNTGLLNQAIWDAGSTGGASPGAGLFFNGPNALAANSGSSVGMGLGLYTPTTFNEGSSVGHLDDENPLYEDLLMSALVGTGASARALSPIEKGIFQDLGYRFVSDSTNNPTSVPTPSLLGGLIAFGLKLSRKRIKQAGG